MTLSWRVRASGVARTVAVRVLRVTTVAAAITLLEVAASYPLVSTWAGRALVQWCGAVPAQHVMVPERVRLFEDVRGTCLGPDSEGITSGRLVIIAEGAVDDPVLRHELTHVVQVERMGSLGFALTYGAMKVTTTRRGGHAYLDHPFEMAAIRR